MAAWRGRDPALQCHDIQEFIAYLRSRSFSSWRPSGIVLHNTAAPNLQQWWHSGVPPAQRLVNIKSYYQDLGWSAGPHAFVDGVSIWIFTDFDVKGVHSPSYNGTRLGIEMVGDYAVESDESGEGLKVMNMTVALFGEVCAFFGWEPNNSIIKLHKEDAATDHDCPGKNVIKSEFLDDVTNYMGDGGDHPPPNPPPQTEYPGVVFGVPSGDTLNIRATPSSSAPIIGHAENDDKVAVVGEEYNGTTRWLRIKLGEGAGTGVEVFGWVSARYVRVEGAVPPATVWHDDITATTFGGLDDPQSSAYPPFALIDGNKPGVSLPYKWRDTAPPVLEIAGPGGSAEAPICDVGPWNINDPMYVNEGRRPLVEEQFAQRVPAQNGQVPTNTAAIDLTPALARLVGIDGKGKVRWRLKTARSDTMTPTTDAERLLAQLQQLIKQQDAPPPPQTDTQKLVAALLAALNKQQPTAVPVTAGVAADVRTGIAGVLGSLLASLTGVIGMPAGPDATATGTFLPLIVAGASALGIPSWALGVAKSMLGLYRRSKEATR
jgi:Bacterial SH3 domain/N-acetylmuramoyl-L-alanine amidase